jgi:heptosyltransferase-2
MSATTGRILVIRGGAIGDFILTLPVLAALRREFPKARLEVLGYPHIARLALEGGLADGVRSIEARPLAGFFARGGELDATLAGDFAGFAVILSYLYDPDGIFQENVARCSKGQFIAGPHRPDEKLNLHAAEALLKPLERLAIFGADPVPRLRMGPPARLPIPCFNPNGLPETAAPEGGAGPGWDRPDAPPMLALHPGSGSEKKNWPEEHWGELIRQLIERTDIAVLLVGGEAEGDRLRRLSANIPLARLQPAQGLSLTELAGRLQTCRGFIGHDSGITHLAAALGLPGLVLWGDTNETVWRPQGGRMVVVRGVDGLRGIAVDSVMCRLRELVSPPWW